MSDAKILSRLNQLRARPSGVISISELSRETGVARSTLTKLTQNEFDGVHSSTLIALCKYFGCNVCDLLEYVPDTEDAE